MEQREIWDDLVGDAWVRDAKLIDAHSAPFGAAAMDRLGPLEHASVLDVGCGTGSTTRELAQRGASAVGIDLSERMVAHARTLAGPAENIRFEAGDVTTLAPPDPFDAVFSRFGVMFFRDAVEGFGHLHALVRPGGRLGFCSWGEPFDNPWMSVAVLASIPILGPPEMPGPGEPGPFSLSTPDRVREVLAAAGWTHIDVDTVGLQRAHPAGGAEAVASMLLAGAPPLALGLTRAPDRAGELHAAVVDALRPHVVDGTVRLTATALIVGAHA